MNRLLAISLTTITLVACNEVEIISPDMTDSAYKKIDILERIIRIHQEDPELSSEVVDVVVNLLEDSVELVENNCLKRKTKDRTKCVDALTVAENSRYTQESIVLNAKYGKK